MVIDRHARPSPPARRPALWLAATAVAVLALASFVVPVLAVDPPIPPDASSSAPASASASPDASSVPDPSAPPSADPSPSASPTPSPSPSPSPSPTPPPTPSPTPTPVDPDHWPTKATTLGATVTLYGRGFGHGVGMSQYGARGRALAGETAAQILAAYFEGSKPATTDPTQIVRVLLLAGYPAVSTAPLSIHGRGGPWTIDGVAGTFPAGGSVRAWRTTMKVDGAATTTWRIKVLAADGRTQLHAGKVTTALIVRPAASATRLQLDAKPASSDTYRGSFKVVLGASSARVVDRLGLDSYLRGVVPVEMPASWPIEALRAQAVAARSDALRRLHPGTGTYDVYDDTRSQVYRGAEAEKAKTNRIIDDAPGAILKSGKQVVNAFFHSSGGGATENNEYAFVGTSGAVTSSPVKYLRGIADRAANGTAFDAAAPYYHWSTTSLTRAQLSAVFRKDPRTNVGDVTRLDLTHRGVSGRLYKVTLIGSAGSKTVSADVFASVYNAGRPSGASPIRSNLFDAAPVR